MTTVDEYMQPLIKRALQPKKLSNCLISLLQSNIVFGIVLHIIAPVKETFAPYLNRRDKK
jgi:capsule polysaccharide export protein KpsE/RkpR